MTRAIEFIEREYQRQPKLAEIARHVGLSEFHFNRLFRRWTGLTPKQYLAEVTSRAAGAALRAEPSVMDAAHSVGLSGGGRLHDLTVTLEAMSPGEIRAGAAGVEIRHGVTETPFGTAFIAETQRGLMRLSFLDGRSDATEISTPARLMAAGEIRPRRCARAGRSRPPSGAREVTNPSHCRWRSAARISRCRCGAPCSNSNRAPRSHTARWRKKLG